MVAQRLARAGRTARAFLLALLLLASPGCLAAAAGGIAYVVGKGKEADATKKAARLDYVQKRRAAGASDAQILAEIRATDPEWAEDIADGDDTLLEIKKP